jgi:hypothetical protein
VGVAASRVEPHFIPAFLPAGNPSRLVTRPAGVRYTATP